MENQKQAIVALSSIKSLYVLLRSAAQETVWLRTYCQTERMLVDILTKALPRARF